MRDLTPWIPVHVECMTPRHTMITGDVARVLGVSTERVRQLDEQLQPVRVGNARRYDPAVVDRVAKSRERQTRRVG